jgi:hypothetical protein
VEEVELVAALIAAGKYSGSDISFSCSNPGAIKRIRKIVASVGAQVVGRSWEKGRYGVRKKGGSASNGKGRINPVRRLLDSWGVGHEAHSEKRIPDRVFGLTTEMVSKFLGMFWSCAGTVTGRSLRVSMMSNSKRLVTDLRRLMLRVGVTCAVRRSKRPNGSVSWMLFVHSSSLEAFARDVPLTGMRRRKFSAKRVKSSPSVGNIPLTRSLRVRMRAEAEIEIPASVLKRSTISPSRLLEIVPIGSEIGSLARSFWDEVVSIEDAGEHDVYDLTVPGSHCFLAGGMVAHNTFTVVMLGLHAWNNGYRVLIITPEMSGVEIAERAYAIQTKTPYGMIVSGTLGVFSESDFFKEVKSLGGTDGFYIVDEVEDMTPARIEQAIDMVNPDLIGVDSAYMIHSTRGNRYERMISTVGWLRELAKKTHKSVVALSQFNREKGRSGLDSFAMTDVIAWDSHNLIGLMQDDDMKADRRMLFSPLKARRQAFSRDVLVNWDFDSMNFSELDAVDDFEDDEFDSDVPF